MPIPGDKPQPTRQEFDAYFNELTRYNRSRRIAIVIVALMAVGGILAGAAAVIL